MLPYTPFRTDLRSESRFIKAEERLIAFGLEMFFYIAKKELNKHKPHVEKDPTVMQVCRYISKYLITCQTDKQLYSYISTRRQRGDKMNPIKVNSELWAWEFSTYLLSCHVFYSITSHIRRGQYSNISWNPRISAM